ncbi:MAG: hypothetical protein JWM28_2060 [Chitinophagaceae bacterium]|nr:hypothetical protein [Chitinophagaceae bacterium]
MKQILTGFLLFTGIVSGYSVKAQEMTETKSVDQPAYKMAVGIRLSSAPAMINNSVSFKYFMTHRTAVEALVSFCDPFALGALVEFYNPLRTSGLQWFYVAGGYLGFSKEYNAEKAIEERKTYFGGQGIVGLDYKFENIPLNLSLDWKPELNLVQDINFEPAALGFTARFTFGH